MDLTLHHHSLSPFPIPHSPFRFLPMPATTPFRPSLARLAADASSVTRTRLWRSLTAEEREAALTAVLAADEQGWGKQKMRALVAKAKRFRPQTVMSWPPAKLVAEAATIASDDVQLVDAALIDLHLGSRRPMMAAFLDMLGIPHEEGRIPDEASDRDPPESSLLERAATQLVALHPPDEVAIYFLTLLVLDRAHWGALAAWLEARGSAD